MNQYELPYELGTYQQLSMAPPDRCRVRMTVSLVGASDHCVVTLDVSEGAGSTQVELATFGAVDESQGWAALGRMLTEALAFHSERLSPF